MRIYVTGVAGFLGSHLAEALVAAGHSVFGCDTLIGGEQANVPDDVEWEVKDCRDLDLDLHGAEVVVHCAALAHEGLSNFSPALITDNIYGASVGLFSNAIAHKVRRIVYLSSMARYGVGVPPFKENDRSRPVDPYGIAKVAAEHTLRSLSKTHGTEYVIAVPHSIFGPRQARWDPYRNVLAIWMNMLAQNKAPCIYGSGTQKRCFSDVSDVVPSLVKMVTDDGLNGEIINIGPDEETVTINEICSMVCAAMGRQGCQPLYLPARPNEVHNAFCSSEKARKILGYKTETPLQEGITRMAEWVQSVGPVPFRYHLPIEITSALTPTTWTEKSL